MVRCCVAGSALSKFRNPSRSSHVLPFQYTSATFTFTEVSDAYFIQRIESGKVIHSCDCCLFPVHACDTARSSHSLAASFEPLKHRSRARSLSWPSIRGRPRRSSACQAEMDRMLSRAPSENTVCEPMLWQLRMRRKPSEARALLSLHSGW